MAQKIDPADLVTFKEFMLANSIQTDAITQLLIDKGIITQEEFVAKLKQVQADYMSRKRQLSKESSLVARQAPTEQHWTLPSRWTCLTVAGFSY
jgi:hypothetical protein